MQSPCQTSKQFNSADSATGELPLDRIYSHQEPCHATYTIPPEQLEDHHQYLN